MYKTYFNILVTNILNKDKGDSMSAFLGPIHYWLYNKIQFQEALTKAVLTDYDLILASLEEICGAVETGDLEEVIDTGNIHGWLQRQIIIAEARFANAVGKLLQEEKVSMEQIETLVYEFGKKHPLTGETAPEIYKQLQDLLLDGMPCDHVNMLVEQTEEKVCWQRTSDLHSSHWEKLSIDGGIYYNLRGTLLKGMLLGSAFSYQQEKDLSIISK